MKTNWIILVAFVFWCSYIQNAMSEYGDYGCYYLLEDQGCDPYGYITEFESCPSSCFPSTGPSCDESVYLEQLSGFNYTGFTQYGYVPNGGSRLASSTYDEEYIECTSEGECHCEEVEEQVYDCVKTESFKWEEYNIHNAFGFICTQWENETYHSGE